MCAADLEKSRDDAASVGDVRVVYVSRSAVAETPHPPPPNDEASGPASASRDVFGDFKTRSAPSEPLWTLLLQAAQQGDDAEARALGMRLAHQVLAAPIIAMAHEVLAGGPRDAAKAVELAERLLADGYALFAQPKVDMH